MNGWGPCVVMCVVLNLFGTHMIERQLRNNNMLFRSGGGVRRPETVRVCAPAGTVKELCWYQVERVWRSPKYDR